MKTVLVGVFEALNDATQARAALLESGFPERTVSVRSKDAAADRTRSDPAIFDNRTDEMRDEPGVIDWLRSLFGQDDAHEETATVYSEAVELGEYLLTVDEVPEERVQTAVDIIDRHGAIDVDERLQQRRSRVSPAVAKGDDLPGVAGRLPAAGPDGIRTDVDQDFGHRTPAEDDRYKLDEQGYPPLHNADPADVARLEARRDRRAATVNAARRGKVQVLRCEPRVKPG